MNRTVASNPAGIRVDLAHAFKCDGKDLILLAVGLIVGGIVAPFHWQAGLIIMGIGAFFPVASLMTLPQHFRDGDVCPAVVLDPDRQLVAVMTNLSKTGRSKYVIRVLSQPLKRAVQRPVKKGTRLAFVAMYSGHAALPNWLNFGGYLADSGTRNSKTIQRVLASIDDADWDLLLDGLKQIEKPYSPGMYDIQSRSRAQSEGAPPAKARKRTFSRITKVGIGFVAGLLFLALAPLLVNALRGGGGGPAGVAPGPVQNAPPVLAAVEQPQNIPFPANGIDRPGFDRNRPGLTSPGDRHLPAAESAPASVTASEGWPSSTVATPAESSPPAFGANPFRPKQAPSDDQSGSPASFEPASPFRPRQAQSPGMSPAVADAASPFRPKRPEPAVLETAGAGSSSDSKPEWKAGDQAEAFWGSHWYPVTILAVDGSRGYRVHWEGYSDNFDEVLPPDRLRPKARN